MNRRLHNDLLSCITSIVFSGMCLLLVSRTPVWAQEPTSQSYTLQSVIDLALTHHPTIEFGKGVIEEKQGDQISASAYPNPSLGIQSGHGQVLDPTGPSLTERYVSLSQPLEWPGTRVARQEAASASVTSAEAGLEVTQLNIKARVKRTFYELLLAETLADLASRLADTVTDFERAVKRRVESGEAPPFEHVKVNVELLQAQKLVSQTKGKVRANQATLNQLTAGNLGEDFSIEGDFESVDAHLNEQKLIEDAFQHHPEVRQYQQLIERASARHHEEQQARVPNVTINGAYQRDAGREGFVGGLSIPLPLWNQRQGDIAKALGIRRQAEANLQEARITLRRGIIEHLQNARTSSAQIQTFEKGLLKQAKEAVRIARTSFKFGEASLMDVLDAQRVLWQTFQGYAQARFELSVALTELERLVGKAL
ncbi:TolC family protein [Candidatus Nitronereus thalassa]|uniref:TolC family protein n=1 Tax=Candidatus Nitronereus thalassa TaxID=3020898 RepID=A0ABU3K907_9BACT|nr:TolC family protein [Candidatus Nitronereus thalassa]MDT7042847.1 TolC family protein [Candidatus Nitronereus thalassa]